MENNENKGFMDRPDVRYIKETLNNTWDKFTEFLDEQADKLDKYVNKYWYGQPELPHQCYMTHCSGCTLCRQVQERGISEIPRKIETKPIIEESKTLDQGIKLDKDKQLEQDIKHIRDLKKEEKLEINSHENNL
jgi:hypothetical protein